LVEFDYLMAGNDLALIKSQEAAEDDVVRSIQDLKNMAEGYEHVVFIGITCGLSAPYVGSQIDYIINGPDVRKDNVMMGVGRGD
jgi:N-acetylmuramic acid 6-phosphate (MurNAc-6-P) etherase